ncbi:hypothetical protein J4760_04630 [Salinicoccus sp. ID82-1]|uniref:DUF6440 domain-containing protein n=1 Tax=Salinicoccus cyprini TaxID=2493691 RepID=A0A558AZP9_9STAP|nr:DUF6440 family protein [Salinicoccus cyprini]MCG1009338.1 hypothetical protein [Salinicoccus sp. ID82-1]TVT29714.1 hypothetical protein FO441_05380 [Salinicoccus cyprini]
MFGNKKDEGDNRFVIEQMKTNDAVFNCYVITDQDTGVQYLYTWGGTGGSMTPLLDENGQVVVKK